MFSSGNAFLLKSDSLACCSCPDQFKRWEEDGLAVLFGEGRGKAAPCGLSDLSVLEESVCFCRQTVGETSIYIMCFGETASWVQLELARRKPASAEGTRR